MSHKDDTATRTDIHRGGGDHCARRRDHHDAGIDARIHLDINAGPLEKVQPMLGKAGGPFGKITDKIIACRVRGPIAKPEVSIKPFPADSRE